MPMAGFLPKPAIFFVRITDRFGRRPATTPGGKAAGRPKRSLAVTTEEDRLRLIAIIRFEMPIVGDDRNMTFRLRQPGQLLNHEAVGRSPRQRSSGRVLAVVTELRLRQTKQAAGANCAFPWG